MDLLAFHLVMLALDVTLFWVLFKWTNKRTWLLSSFAILIAVLVFSKLFENHRVQQVLEGLCWHWAGYMIAAGVLLFIRKRRYSAIASWIVSVPILLLGADAMLYEPYALRVVHYEIKTPKVSRPYRIAIISDIQTDVIGSYEKRTIRTLKEQNADIVLFGGDYLQAYGKNPLPDYIPVQFNRMIKDADFRPPLGAYAVPGDTDGAPHTELFADTGVRAITKTEILHLDGIDLTFFMERNPDRKIYRQPDEMKRFHVMLSHIPAYALGDRASGKDKCPPDLMLAGHTHGGQISIPFHGPLFSNTPGLPTTWMRGMRTLPNGSRLLITPGTGLERAWGPRIRFNCRPEVSVIDIVPENPQQ